MIKAKLKNLGAGEIIAVIAIVIAIAVVVFWFVGASLLWLVGLLLGKTYVVSFWVKVAIGFVVAFILGLAKGNKSS